MWIWITRVCTRAVGSCLLIFMLVQLNLYWYSLRLKYYFALNIRTALISYTVIFCKWFFINYGRLSISWLSFMCNKLACVRSNSYVCKVYGYWCFYNHFSCYCLFKVPWKVTFLFSCVLEEVRVFIFRAVCYWLLDCIACSINSSGTRTCLIICQSNLR